MLVRLLLPAIATALLVLPATLSPAATVEVTNPLLDASLKAIDALRAGDVEAFNKLLVDPAYVKSICPNHPLADIKTVRLRAKVAKSMVKCGSFIPLDKATLIAMSLEPDRTPAAECNRGVAERLHDVRFWFEYEGKRMEIRLDDPIRVGDRVMFADDPRCRPWTW